MITALRETLLTKLRLRTETGPTISSGTGSPEGAVTAVVGSQYVREDGGTGTTLYIKETGTGSTGWVPVTSGGGGGGGFTYAQTRRLNAAYGV